MSLSSRKPFRKAAPEGSRGSSTCADIKWKVKKEVQYNGTPCPDGQRAKPGHHPGGVVHIAYTPPHSGGRRTGLQSRKRMGPVGEALARPGHSEDPRGVPLAARAARGCKKQLRRYWCWGLVRWTLVRVLPQWVSWDTQRTAITVAVCGLILAQPHIYTHILIASNLESTAVYGDSNTGIQTRGFGLYRPSTRNMRILSHITWATPDLCYCDCNCENRLASLRLETSAQ